MYMGKDMCSTESLITLHHTLSLYLAFINDIEEKK